MKKFLLLATSVAMTLAMTTRAEAAIQFDPTGGGCASVCYTIDVFDPTVGNSLSVGLNANSGVGSTGQLYSQADLGIASLNGTQQYANGQNGAFFTFAAAFQETVLSNSGGAFPTIVFGAPGATGTQGVFNMYLQGADANDLNGTCFVQSCGGTLILSGSFINNTDFFGTFTANTQSPPQALDQTSDGNNYPATQTVTGTGGFGADILVNFANPLFFPNLAPGSVLQLVVDTLQTLPFDEVNPSACFSNNAVTSCNTPGVASVGPINGLGTNTMLQTDASLTIINTAEIPEPATMTMLGLGLLGVAAARKLRSRKA